MIEKNLARYRHLFHDYTELRAQEMRYQVIAFLNGNLVANHLDVNSGISARVYQAGSWGFASHPGRDDSAIKTVVTEAGHNAGFLARKLRKKLPPLPVSAAHAEKNLSTHKQRLSQKELIQFNKELEHYIGQNYKNLVSRRVIIQNIDREISLLTSLGAESYTFIPRSKIYISLSAEKDGAPVEVYDVTGGLGHFEDLFRTPADLHPFIDNLYNKLLDKREGERPESGVVDCILDSRVAGILAHEAVGHTTEADLVLGGSVAANNLQKPVASPLVTLVDFAHTALGKTCPEPVYVDDEGTPPEDVVIIEQGILKQYMHNRESAMLFETAPTGNARAWTFSDEPLIRMRNTAILPGKDKLADMIASIQDGYYLCATGNGQADATGEFTFAVTQGYRIHNGKLGKAILDTTITGIAFEMLKTVTMVSDEMHWTVGGLCGKKQLMTVGMGGPSLKCRVMIGGK